MHFFKNRLQARIRMAVWVGGCVLMLSQPAAAVSDADDPVEPSASGAATTTPIMPPTRRDRTRSHKKESHLAPPAAPKKPSAPLRPGLRFESEAQKKARLGR